MTDEDLMRRAIAAARQGIAAGQSPFGAVIARDGQVLIEAHNEVRAGSDPTAHAEVQAIRKACLALGTIDLAGCVMYATTEPCPMCFSAIHWAKLDRVVFGAAIADAESAGFSELTISNETMKEIGGSGLTIQPGVLADECAALFDEWKHGPNAIPY